MKTLSILFSITLGTCLWSTAAPLSSAFTYQGTLNSGGSRANGWYDLSFYLYDAETAGAAIGQPVQLNGVAVSNGLFSVTLDFGANAFGGDARWLEIHVRTNLAPDAVILSPRQALRATPYSLFSLTSGALNGLLPDSQLSGNIARLNASQTFTATVSFSPPSGPPFTVSSSERVPNLNADLLDGLDSTFYWKLFGNAGTTAGTHFLGTTDNQALELKVYNQRALRLEPTGSIPNVIAGHPENSATGAIGATIGGGGINKILQSFIFIPNQSTISGGSANNITGASFSSIGGGQGNTVIGAKTGSLPETMHHGTIGGGDGNAVDLSDYASIGGGSGNRIQGHGIKATIAGGSANLIDGKGNSWGATIGGGTGNNHSGTHDSTIVGGENNLIFGGGEYNPPTRWGTIGGGSGNRIQNESYACTIGGGKDNFVAECRYSTIVGGSFNSIRGSSTADFGSVIVGGLSNQVTGAYGTILGGQASFATNRAFAGGRRAKAVHEGSFVWGDGRDADILSSTSNQFTVRASGGTRIFSDSASTVGVQLLPGDNAWSVLSDRNAKQNLEAVDCAEVLEKVAALPVTTWQLKSQPDSVRHMGPMAQDFQAAFGLGASERVINTSDADGVALAAIKGLHAALKAKDQEISDLKAESSDLKTRLEKLERLIANR